MQQSTVLQFFFAIIRNPLRFHNCNNKKQNMGFQQAKIEFKV